MLKKSGGKYLVFFSFTNNKRLDYFLAKVRTRGLASRLNVHFEEGKDMPARGLKSLKKLHN